MVNEGMREHWTGDAGQRWVRDRDTLDAMLAPFLEALLDVADVRPGEAVIDIGCGAGTTTIAFARRVAPGGRVVGADISPLLVGELARRLAEMGEELAVQPVVADAQVDPLPGPFDVIGSRFGVMFFDDQAAAWRNIRAASRRGGRLAFSCWQGPEKNPWSRVPALAALDLSPSDDPPPEPGASGPYAFAEPARTHTILEQAGWRDVACTPLITDMLLGRTLTEAFGSVRGSAAVGGAIERVGEGPVRDAVTSALAPYADASGAVRLSAAGWIVTARA